jgi:glyoxylase-like metal-dependent hydrolase (beta-lactamase superfamily II)
VTITKIVEWEAATDLSWFIPAATPAALKQIEWLYPHFANKDGLAISSIHALVIETPSKRIMVDPCIGANKLRSAMPMFDRIKSPFLEDLKAAGYEPESIDVVLNTHLHVDHVGWNTMLVDGKWIPTFKNARYLFSRVEYDYWIKGTDISKIGWDVTQRETYLDSMKPVVDAGRVDFMEAPYKVCDEVRLIPTSGHSPGHMSVAISSKGERALITGDTCHHPAQLAHVDWGSVVDFDPAAALSTRRAMFEEVAGKPVLLLGTHFPGPSGGYVERDGDAFRLRVRS